MFGKISGFIITVITLIIVIASCTLRQDGVNGGAGVSSSSCSISPDTRSNLPAVYVTTTGNDANAPGTNKSLPLKTIQSALSNAAVLGISNIFIGAGTYSPGSGLNSDGTNGILITNSGLNLIGGWDNLFTGLTVRTVLDGSDGVCHVVAIRAVSNVYMEGFDVKRGYAQLGGNDDYGGGFYLGMAQNIMITNVDVYFNSAKSSGGGICIECSTNNIITASVYGNIAVQSYGGGLFIGISSGNTIYGSIYGNIATNSASGSGGGITLFLSSANTIAASCYGNSANAAGGLYLGGWSSNNIISGPIYGNSANISAGGVLFTFSDNNIISLISNNYAGKFGGGVYIGPSSNNVFSNIINNTAGTSGGGVYTNIKAQNTFLNITGNKISTGTIKNFN